MLLSEAPCATILPAGCGKTELLTAVAGVGASSGPILVLTHTNAGVAVLRSRMLKRNADLTAISIRTLSSFSERICRAYPESASSGSDNSDFEGFHEGAARFVATSVGGRIARASWHLVLVDEYQDCTLSQHRLVQAIAAQVPTIVAGDPLQSVFNFREEEIVPWPEVTDAFDPVQLPQIPHRWATTNPQLGSDLTALRSLLLSGQAIDLRDFKAIRYRPYSDKSIHRAASDLAALDGQSLIVHFGKVHAQAVTFAKGMKNHYSAIEPRRSATLRELCENLDRAGGEETVALVLAAAEAGLANLGAAKTKLRQIADGKKPRTGKTTSSFDVAVAGLGCAENPCAKTVTALVRELLRFDGVTNARRQMWDDLITILRTAERNPALSFEESFDQLAASRQRNVRYPDGNIVARTVMVKGLEFPHALILRADRLDTCQLYVAATRASQTLWVTADHPVLQPQRLEQTRRGPSSTQKPLPLS